MGLGACDERGLWGIAGRRIGLQYSITLEAKGGAVFYA
jgi:hypothetical protein